MNEITEWVCWRQTSHTYLVHPILSMSRLKTQESRIDVSDVDWFSAFDVASIYLASGEKDWLLLNAAARAESQ